MNKLKNLVLVLVAASGCVDETTIDAPDNSAGGPGGSGGSGSGTGSGSGGSDGSNAIVGGWRAPFSDGTADRLDISASLSGTAQLYWYDYSWADWEVDVAIVGGDHVVTLECPHDPDCIDAEPIVMTCDPMATRMSCIGTSGGYGNNYAGVTFDWQK